MSTILRAFNLVQCLSWANAFCDGVGRMNSVCCSHAVRCEDSLVSFACWEGETETLKLVKHIDFLDFFFF